MIWNFLFQLFIAFVLNVIAYALLPKPKRQRAEATDQRRELETPTADTGRPIPVAFGTVNVLSPNVLFMADKHAVQLPEYRENPNLVAYYSTIHYGICQGPIDWLHRIRIREKTVYGNTQALNKSIVDIRNDNLVRIATFTRNIAHPYFGGGVDREGGVVGRMLFDPGTFNAVVPELTREKYGDLADRLPAYTGVATVLFTDLDRDFSPLVHTESREPYRPSKGFYWGVNSPFIHPADFMVTRIPSGWNEALAEIPSRFDHLLEEEVNELRDEEDADDDDKDIQSKIVRYAVGPDCNPAHIIRECQTDLVWGGEVPVPLIDDISYREAAQTFFDERLGLSELWVRQATIGDFIDDVLSQCETVLYVSPRTGKFVLKPIRSGYDVSTLIHFSEENSRVTDFAQKVAGEIPNEIIVSWTNPLTEKEDSVTLHNLAGIVQADGEIISDTRTYAGIRYADTAWNVAERELSAIAAGLAAMDVETDRRAWEVSPGDVVRLTSAEHNLDDEVVRVLYADYGRPGDSQVSLKVIQDVFAQQTPDWEAPAQGAVPGIPRNFRLTPGDEQVLMEWDAPLFAGASPISHYEYLRDGTVWRKIPGGGAARSFTVRGLVNGARHSFRLRAVNKAGPGLPTVPLFIGADAAGARGPGEPLHFGLRFVGSEVELFWLAPATDGGSPILRYEVDIWDTTDVAALNLRPWQHLPEEANVNLYHRVVGLIVGRRYSFQLRAVNAVQPGTPTPVIEIEFIPGGEGHAQPPNPEGFDARGAVRSIALWWSNPFDYYLNHSRTLVFRSTTPDYVDATQIGFSVGVQYFDMTVEPDVDYYYWIIWESTRGRLSNPAGPAGPVSAVENIGLKIRELSAEIFSDELTKALLSAIDRPSSPFSAASLYASLFTRQALELVGLQDERVIALAARLMTIEGDYATAVALQRLRVEVEQTDTLLRSTAQELTALEAMIGGRILGPETNTFEAASREAAEAARDAFQAANPMVAYGGETKTWLQHYDDDNDINIELIWGVEYVYQRRLNGAWIDNGEVLARAAAVANLNTEVIRQGNRITGVSESVTSLETRMLNAISRAETALGTRITSIDGRVTVVSESVTNLLAQVGSLSAQAFMELVARVDDNEMGLARWLVKTRVGDLSAGIGLYNDGATTKFYLQADRLAIIPTGVTLGARPPENTVSPFIVENGQVYIDRARIRDLRAENIALGQGLVRAQQVNYLTPEYVQGATETGEKMFNTQSYNVENVRLETIRDEVAGVDTDAIIFDIRPIRGFIQPGQPRLWTRLWRGRHSVGREAGATPLTFTLPGGAKVSDFDLIMGSRTYDRNETREGIFGVRTGSIPTSGGVVLGPFVSDTGIQVRQNASGTQLTFSDSGFSHYRSWFYTVWGVKNPDSGSSPPPSPPPSPTPTPTPPPSLPAASAPTVTISAVSSATGSITLTASVTGGTYDTLTYAWSVDSGDGSITGSGSSVTWNPPSISAGSSRSIGVDVTVTARGTGTRAESGTVDTDSDSESFTYTRPAAPPTPPPSPPPSSVPPTPNVGGTGRAVTVSVTGDRTSDLYVEFQVDDNSGFSSPTTLYLNIGTYFSGADTTVWVHLSGLPSTSGTYYVRSRLRTERNGGGTAGSWSSTSTRNV